MKIRKARYRLKGGVHPRYCKELTSANRTQTVPLPGLLAVSMAQHFGLPAQPVVKKGDRVLRGQLIGEPAGFVSAAVHAPTSGIVKGLEKAPTPGGSRAMAVLIECDGEDRIDPSVAGNADLGALNAEELVSIVAKAGIVGMGGAGFPTHVKLSPPPNRKIDTLIINGAECEPYLTADYRLMLEHPQKIRGGIEVMRKILKPDSLRLAIEDNKPEAIRVMERVLASLDGYMEIAVLDSCYPQGAEKQQIYSITGREIQHGQLPMDIGVLVENVGTVAAIWDAVSEGLPQTSRIMTVTGSPVVLPSNVIARIGTPFSHLVEFCGGISGNAAKIVCGGPMMGFAQSTLNVTVAKTTSGLVVLSDKETSPFLSIPCIGCGRCIEACPMGLMPNELSRCVEAKDYPRAERNGLLDCIECGCCAFGCPAHRPLIQHMRVGKTEIKAPAHELAEK
jgi:electron transport complex protein RnfC